VSIKALLYALILSAGISSSFLKYQSMENVALYRDMHTQETDAEQREYLLDHKIEWQMSSLTFGAFSMVFLGTLGISLSVDLGRSALDALEGRGKK